MVPPGPVRLTKANNALVTNSGVVSVHTQAGRNNLISLDTNPVTDIEFIPCEGT
jgi:hypothetical protein